MGIAHLRMRVSYNKATAEKPIVLTILRLMASNNIQLA